VRFLVVPAAPINFAEYGRLLPPHALDLGGLAYAAQPLFLRPLQTVLPSALDAAFLLNAFLAALALPALFDILVSVSARREAFLAVPLLAFNPVFLRVSGSSAETVGFTFVSLLLFGQVLRAHREPLPAVAVPCLAFLLAAWRPEGVFLVPPLLLPMCLHLVRRTGGPPERPCAREPGTGAEADSSPGYTEGILSRVAQGGALLSALATEAVFLSLFLRLPMPSTPAGLLPSHAADLLSDLLDPRLFSPLLLPLAAAGGVVLLVGRASVQPQETCSGASRQEAGQRPPGERRGENAPASTSLSAAPVCVLLLLALWTVQGVEKNLVFGSARYAVMLLPWLLLSAVPLFARRRPVPASLPPSPQQDRRSPHRLSMFVDRPADPPCQSRQGLAAESATIGLRTRLRRYFVDHRPSTMMDDRQSTSLWCMAIPVVLMLTCLPQLPLLWTEADTQNEYRFMTEAVSRLPDNALVLVPAASRGDDEFTPESSAAAVLADRLPSSSWMPLHEAVEHPEQLRGEDVFLLVGRYAGCGDRDVLAGRCALEPVLTRTVPGVPDLALFPDPCPQGRAELDLGLFKVICP